MGRQTYAIVIAPVIGIDQESGDGMLADRLKKILRSRARPAWPTGCRGVLIERMQNFVLLLGLEPGEFGRAREHLAHSRLQFGQALPVCLLIVDGESGQATIDEINDTGFTRPRSVIRWNDAGGDRFDFRSLFRSEEFEFRRRARLPCPVSVRRGGQQGRPIR